MIKPLLTRAAEGLDRWGWTNAKIQQLVEAGVLDEDAPFELIRGEMVPLNAEFNAHAKMRWQLHERFVLAVRDLKIQPRLLVGSEISLFLFDDTELKPDVAIFDARLDTQAVRGPDVLLAIEIASSSQRRDLVVKPPIYAQSGLAELWVVDLDGGATHMHRQPGAHGYGAITAHAFGETLTAMAFPAIPVRIADFL